MRRGEMPSLDTLLRLFLIGMGLLVLIIVARMIIAG